MPGWTPRARPARVRIEGRTCAVEPLDAARHATDLYAANSADPGGMWTYLFYGPFTSEDEYTGWVARSAQNDDPLFFAIIDKANQKAVGVASLMRIDPANGVIEVGHLAFSPALQRTPAATEAIYLLINAAFELGYRRCEWKCDALNAPSRSAAVRYGFVYEGTFRQAVIYKGRSRDTAWFSIIDSEWPALQDVFVQWLHPSNFDERGRQRTSLSELTMRTRGLSQA